MIDSFRFSVVTRLGCACVVPRLRHVMTWWLCRGTLRTVTRRCRAWALLVVSRLVAPSMLSVCSATLWVMLTGAVIRRRLGGSGLVLTAVARSWVGLWPCVLLVVLVVGVVRFVFFCLVRFCGIFVLLVCVLLRVCALPATVFLPFIGVC